MDWIKVTDEELIDSFDRAFEKGNIYLHNPEQETFRPWNKYPKVQFQFQRAKIRETIVEHYYGYWQIHQLYFLQQYPDLFRNYSLIKSLTKKKRAKYNWYPRAFNKEIYKTFRKNGTAFVPIYDSLSFFFTLYYRERERNFAKAQEKYNVKQLDENEYEDLKKAQKNNAQFVCLKFGVTEETLINYIHNLLELRAEYIKSEKNKLTTLIDFDISVLYSWIWALTGKTWEEVSQELKFNFDKIDFLKIDFETKRFYDSKMILERHFSGLTKWNLTPSPPESYSNEILIFCQKNGLDIFLHYLPEFVATQEETRKFLPQTRYTNLKNLTNFFEYFLKALAVKAKADSTGTMNRVMQNVLSKSVKADKSWLTGYTSVKKDANSFQELLQNLQSAKALSNQNNTDKEISKTIIITFLARNFTTHNYTQEDQFYFELFGELSSAVFLSIFYFWHLAKIEGWV